MTLHEFKAALVEGKLTNELIIFVCQDNTFLADQYVDALCTQRGLAKECIESTINEYLNGALSIVFSPKDRLGVLKTDVFKESVTDLDQLENIVVICNKLDKAILESCEPFVVRIGKLLDWHIVDYIRSLCPTLEGEQAHWLYQACHGDIYKILNEVDKLRLFDPVQHRRILYALKTQPNTDLYTTSAFALSEAIIKNDKRQILGYLHHRQAFDLEPLALVSLLLNNYKKIAWVVLNSGVTPAALGLSQKQYNAIAYYYKHYKHEQILPIIQFLSAIDFRLRSGQLEVDKQYLVDYIFCKVFEFI